MSDPDHDPSIEHEPQFRDRPFAPDPSDAPEAALHAYVDRSPDVDVEHSVWDEPTLAADLAGGPGPEQVTYARWLDEKVAGASYATSLAVTAALIVLAGPLGIFGALFAAEGGGLSTGGLVAVAIIGPITEEIAKIAGTLWVVEKRPYLFKSMWQILVAAAAGGLFFGVIENLIYLNIYIPNAPSDLARWRWSVCIGLHLNCSFVAGVGLVRIWDHAMRNRVPPQLGRGMPYFATAMLGHGLYNLMVSLAEVFGWLDFAK
jgi:hypothetical protein